ncbi:MAG: ABC transporter substrate-binding protein [Bacillota bacterium]|nr:ABC transporter substrate-binding protein [Bacillota bacterium]
MLALSILVTACGTGPSAATAKTSKVRLGLSTWIGFAPLYVAKEKGFFEKEGVDVELLLMEGVAERRSALAAGKIHGFVSTVDTHVVTAASGVPVVQVLALDDSYGGDGIVALKKIQSLQDLVGRKVAVQTDGGASYFWFLYLLEKEGISPAQIQFQSMSAGEAGAAFVAGKVDAAVTWQPWLSRAENTSFGHVLLKSDATPGVIADTLALRQDFVGSQPQAVRGIVAAWFDALDFIQANPDESYAIMAKAMGLTAEEFKSQLSDIRWYDRTMNQAYFGTPEKPGPLYDLTAMAASFWKRQGLIEKEPQAKDLIDGTFLP